jgi:hypothetical protein
MAKIFTIHMLPARQGDCLWIEYGDEQAPRRLLIDGGTPETHQVLQQRIQALPKAQRRFELLVITHIDSDHIGGALPLFADDPDVAFEDVWYNAWRHLFDPDHEAFGPVQGEKLARSLDEGGLAWNKAFGGKRVCIPKSGPLPTLELPGGMRLTLLSPGADELKKLRPYWAEECKKSGLVPGESASSSHPAPPGYEAMGPVNIDALALEAFTGDGSPANASSIALLAEYEGQRALLAGDAHADVLLKSVKRLVPAGERLHLDAFKLAHHGSKHNLSRDLLDRLDCRNYLISTDGTQFKHPDRQAVARVLKYGGLKPQLHFNARSDQNLLWDSPSWQKLYGYAVFYPEPGQAGKLELLS